ncbi:hypothetical protein [Primorskyibacter flagellatus]|uniref:hypothetical protein n=1 Tax=Primorskyibacter flagellatus TaxID=1387277 RepID=UPI003A91F258
MAKWQGPPRASMRRFAIRQLGQKALMPGRFRRKSAAAGTARFAGPEFHANRSGINKP